MSRTLFVAVFLSASSCLADQAPSFYGFTVGENLGASKANMKSRDLYFMDAVANAKNVAEKRSTFEVMKHPDNCTEDANKELRTVSCSMTKGDVESLVLFYLNDKLMRIVAKFRGRDTSQIKKKLAEKFPAKQVEAAKDFIQGLEGAVTGKITLEAMLASPFAIKGRCDSCDLTMFVQSNVTDGVFFMKEDGGLYLTVFSIDRIRTELDRIAQDNKGQKKTAF